jgi:DNA helicase-2/ATP-dependent DNA helicase PcrA
LHAAKGLEFPIVFIVGLNDGTLPHIRSFEEAEAMQEERRLFYVGITRARNRLYLVIPLNRSQYGRAEPAEESRFLEDIPPQLLDDGHPSRSGRRARAGTSSRADRWEGAATAHARLLQPRYHPGMRIVHSVYGEGIVLDSSIQDDDEIVDIYFEKFGLKRVAASLAKMDRQFE